MIETGDGYEKDEWKPKMDMRRRRLKMNMKRSNRNHIDHLRCKAGKTYTWFKVKYRTPMDD